MKRLIFALLVASSAFGALANLFVGTGTPENALVAGDGYITGDAEVDGVLLLDAIAIPVDDVTPDVAGGNIAVTGVNTVPTALTDLDNPIPGATYTLICGDIANASTIADAGNFTLAGGWNPTAVGDSITLYCRADNDYVEVSRAFVAAGGGEVFGDPFIGAAGLVGTPTYTWLGDLDTGEYWIGANSYGIAVAGANVGTWDATGLAAVGFNGPLGTVVPAQVEATNIYGSADFYFGQTPPDLHEGYKDRSDFITFQDDFTVSVDTEYVLDWDLTAVVGAGTNTVSVRPGWSELVTGGAGVDSESTRSFGLTNARAYTPRMESVVDLTNLVTQRFEWGFWAAANEYVVIAYDVAVGANWILQIDDTTGAETVDSLVAATVDPTKLEIAVDAAGNVSWAINDVAMPAPTGATLMTANGHYTWWELTDTAAAAHTVAVDYVQIEQLKQQ